MEFTTWFNGQRLYILTDLFFVVTSVVDVNRKVVELSAKDMDEMQRRVIAIMDDAAWYNSEVERA